MPGWLDWVQAFHSFLAEFVVLRELVRLKQVSATAEEVDHLPLAIGGIYASAVLAVNIRSCRQVRVSLASR